MAQVVGQAGRVDEVRVAAQGGAELAADLAALERMRQPGPRDQCLHAHGFDDLRLARKASQRTTVEHPRPVALERRPGLAVLGLVDAPLP